MSNRVLVLDRLNQAFFVAWRQKVQHAILYVIIDRWQALVDEYGQTETDRLLNTIDHKFTGVLREEDTVANLGDGELAILVSHIDTDNVATTTVGHVVDKLTNVFEQVFVVAEQSLLLSSSIGVAMVPEDGDDASAILNNAEQAANIVNANGGDDFVFFSDKLQHLSHTRSLLIKQLHQALKTDQLQLYYQALVNDNGQIIGTEALLYWQHPEHGLISPEQFIPLAEDSGLISQIGAWVLATACQQFIEFRQSDASGLLENMAVNISAKQFYAPDFYPLVDQAIKQTGIDPELLVLDITEDLMQQGMETADDIILKVSSLGVRFAIDNFATGYSSLVNLEQLPILQLKIDQSFTDNIEETNARKIIAMIIGMAKHLDVEVIAKGVETTDQQQQLYQLGCVNYQGFLFNKPMSANDFNQLLAQDDRDFAVL